jgi:hypothetical protein
MTEYGSKRGEINGYTCDDCARKTYIVHVDDGVTPMFLACRADGIDPSQQQPPARCQGRGVSMMYPNGLVPQDVLEAVAWEWYAASKTELKRMKRDEPEMYDHCIKGGLLLRPLTDAGREALREFHDYEGQEAA